MSYALHSKCQPAGPLGRGLARALGQTLVRAALHPPPYLVIYPSSPAAKSRHDRWRFESSSTRITVVCRLALEHVHLIDAASCTFNSQELLAPTQRLTEA
jgi:hypothetical protein